MTYGNIPRYEGKSREIHGVHKRGIWKAVPEYIVEEEKQQLADMLQRKQILELARKQNETFAPKTEKL